MMVVDERLGHQKVVNHNHSNGCDRLMIRSSYAMQVTDAYPPEMYVLFQDVYCRNACQLFVHSLCFVRCPFILIESQFCHLFPAQRGHATISGPGHDWPFANLLQRSQSKVQEDGVQQRSVNSTGESLLLCLPRPRLSLASDLPHFALFSESLRHHSCHRRRTDSLYSFRLDSRPAM